MPDQKHWHDGNELKLESNYEMFIKYYYQRKKNKGKIQYYKDLLTRKMCLIPVNGYNESLRRCKHKEKKVPQKLADLQKYKAYNNELTEFEKKRASTVHFLLIRFMFIRQLWRSQGSEARKTIGFQPALKWILSYPMHKEIMDQLKALEDEEVTQETKSKNKRSKSKNNRSKSKSKKSPKKQRKSTKRQEESNSEEEKGSGDDDDDYDSQEQDEEDSSNLSSERENEKGDFEEDEDDDEDYDEEDDEQNDDEETGDDGEEDEDDDDHFENVSDSDEDKRRKRRSRNKRKTSRRIDRNNRKNKNKKQTKGGGKNKKQTKGGGKKGKLIFGGTLNIQDIITAATNVKTGTSLLQGLLPRTIKLYDSFVILY